MDSQREKLIALLKGFDTGVLVTKTNSGTLHGRPMEMAKVEEDGSFCFPASIQCPKVKEIEQDSQVGVFFQKNKQWLSISGTCEITRDRELIEAVWKESWKVWFPDGKEGKELCLLYITPTSGEYWDISGQKGVSFVLEAVKAYIGGTKPNYKGDNQKLAM